MKILKTFLLGSLLIIATAADDLTTAATGKPSCCAKPPVAEAPLTDRSLYQLESDWTNDAARTVKLSSLAGRPQVVTMFFANCVYACPILVHDMKRIEAALSAEARTNTGFTLISFDSERDTPKVLSRFRKEHELAANWNLLRGEPDDVLEMAALLGVKFKKDARGQFAHSNLITVLNADGEIVFQQAGLNSDPAALVLALQTALEKSRK